MSVCTKQVTHIITTRQYLDQGLRDWKREAASNVTVVGPSWVEKCIKERRIDYSANNFVGEAKLFEHKRFYLLLPSQSTGSLVASPSKENKSTKESKDAASASKATEAGDVKQRLREAILQREGEIAQSLTADVSFIISEPVHFKTRTDLIAGIPIVSTKWIEECCKQGELLDWKPFQLTA